MTRVRITPRGRELVAQAEAQALSLAEELAAKAPRTKTPAEIRLAECRRWLKKRAHDTGFSGTWDQEAVALDAFVREREDAARREDRRLAARAVAAWWSECE